MKIKLTLEIYLLLSVLLLNFLSPIAIAYNENSNKYLSAMDRSCDRCRASESEPANAAGLSENARHFISDASSSDAKNYTVFANVSNAAVGLSPNGPLRPFTPQGPSRGEVTKKLYFKTKAANPEGGDIKYVFEWWENGEMSIDSTGYVAPDEWVTKSHAWHGCRDNNFVRVKAIDKKTGEESEWSSNKKVTIFSVPQVPDVRVPCCACISKAVQISASTIDYCNNNVRYQYDYGDGRTVTTGFPKPGQRNWQWVSWNKA